MRILRDPSTVFLFVVSMFVVWGGGTCVFILPRYLSVFIHLYILMYLPHTYSRYTHSSMDNSQKAKSMQQ